MGSPENKQDLKIGFYHLLSFFSVLVKTCPVARVSQTVQVLCSELDILQTENFFFSVTKQKKTQKKTICKEVAKFKGKSSFLLSDFQFKVGYRDRVIAFLCFKGVFF